MFVQARNYTKGRRKAIRLIVIHDMEAGQSKGTAESVARFFHDQAAGDNGSSAHCCTDQDSLVDCVREEDTAWAAPNANGDGYHIEHAGYAKDTARDWLSDPDKAMLEISAARAASVAVRHRIPARRLTLDEIRAGKPGFAGHVDITNALCGGQGHTDPGPNFPWDYYLSRVKAHVEAQNPSQPAKPAKKKPGVKTPPAWFKRTLALGAKGADVGRLQDRLQAHGFYKGYTRDGDYGQHTELAVKRFQASRKLAVDGVCGRDTAIALG